MLHLSTIVGVIVVVVVVIPGIMVVITATPQFLKIYYISTRSGQIMRRNKKRKKVVRIKIIFAIDMV